MIVNEMPAYLNLSDVTKVLFSEKCVPLNALRKLRLWAQSSSSSLTCSNQCWACHVDKCIKGMNKHLCQETRNRTKSNQHKRSKVQLKVEIKRLDTSRLPMLMTVSWQV